MNVRHVLTLASVALLTAALAAPALAGGRSRNRGGAAQGDTVRTQTQQRLRDGSCLQAGAAAQVRTQTRTQAPDGAQAGARDQVRQRLRDGSCLTAPAPAQ